MSFIIWGMQAVEDFFNKYEDSRSGKLFLMSSPFFTLTVCISYVTFVKYLGPMWMKDRKPFELRRVLIAYNLFQVVFNTWMFYRLSSDGWLSGNYNWRCQPMDYSNKLETLRIVDIMWWYYISKFVDLFDTFFFVLKKKFDHISTLHVFHHGIMPLSVWIGLKVGPDGHGTFFGFLNTFVHIVMYTYYMLSALGPNVQKYLWWKKHLTALQMLQFVGMLIHSFQPLLIECDYPRILSSIVIVHAFMFLFLFNGFYNEAYNKKGKPKSAKPPSGNGQSFKGQQNRSGAYSNGMQTTKRNVQVLDSYMSGRIPLEREKNTKRKVI